MPEIEVTKTEPQTPPPSPQVMTKDQLKSVIGEVVQDTYKQLGMHDVLERLQEMEAKQEGHFARGAPIDESTPEDTGKGHLAGQVIRILANLQKNPRFDALKYSVDHYGEHSKVTETVRKTLASDSAAAGGFLLQETVSREIIELLRAQATVTRLGPRFLPLDGKLSIPKHSAGAAGGWIGENANIPKTTVTFGNVVLDPKKYASLIPISNDLLRKAGGEDADSFVRDDMVADISSSLDIAYIRADGSAAQPKGLRFWGTATAVTASFDLDKVTADVAGMLQRMGDSNGRFIRIGSIMEWRTWKYLYTVRTTNGPHAFKEEMDRGMFFGFPFARTSQIPRNLGGGSDESEFYMADFDSVVIGQHQNLLIDVSDTAAYHDGSAVQAPFSLDQTVIRAITEVDLVVRHASDVQILTAVDWL